MADSLVTSDDLYLADTNGEFLASTSTAHALKKIKVGGVEYLLSATYIEDDDGNKRTWSDITELIDEGFETVILSSLPEANEDNWNTYRKSIVFVSKGTGKEGYYAYVILRSGSSGSYTYVWSQLGNEDVDLTNYATKEYVEGQVSGKQDSLSETQLNAVNSGITSEKVASYDSAVVQLGGVSLVKLTQAQYDALSKKDENTLYMIVG